MSQCHVQYTSAQTVPHQGWAECKPDDSHSPPKHTLCRLRRRECVWDPCPWGIDARCGRWCMANRTECRSPKAPARSRAHAHRTSKLCGLASDYRQIRQKGRRARAWKSVQINVRERGTNTARTEIFYVAGERGRGGRDRERAVLCCCRLVRAVGNVGTKPTLVGPVCALMCKAIDVRLCAEFGLHCDEQSMFGQPSLWLLVCQW